MVVCRTAWYVEVPLQRGFGGMHWMEGADPRCLTLVSFKCIILTIFLDFNVIFKKFLDFVDLHKSTRGSLCTLPKLCPIA